MPVVPRGAWPSTESSNTGVLPYFVATISLKLTKAQAKLLAEASKEQGFPSKSEFVRYAIARALEDRLSVKTIEDVFESRRQIRAGKTIPLERLMEEE
jgi:Arc/MetJ-type ribon-helix-helix transcriptional regulator